MSSTAETPSIEQKGSCRCSREPPWKISKECSEFKSRTPRFAPRLAESGAFRAATRPLTGQQCGRVLSYAFLGSDVAFVADFRQPLPPPRFREILVKFYR